jgi:hypothetical protein
MLLQRHGRNNYIYSYFLSCASFHTLNVSFEFLTTVVVQEITVYKPVVKLVGITYIFAVVITIVMPRSDCRRGFGLEIGFIDHFNTRLVTTLHYSAIADLHTLQIITAHLKSFQSAVSSPVVPL